MEKYSWSANVLKLMQWRPNSGWTKYGIDKNIVMRAHFDQIFICSGNNNIIESLNVKGKIKGFFKNGVLAIVLADCKGSRKLKIQFEGDAALQVQKLGKFFPIAGLHEQYLNVSYQKLEDIIQTIMDRQDTDQSSFNKPANFDNFVKFCILDPAFASVVNETEKVLQTMKQ